MTSAEDRPDPEFAPPGPSKEHVESNAENPDEMGNAASTRREALVRGAGVAGAALFSLAKFPRALRAQDSTRGSRGSSEVSETQNMSLIDDRQERRGIALFNGQDLEGWTTLDGMPVTRGWVVENGVLHRKEAGGDLLSAEEYGDYELTFEWRISAGGNSGVKFRVRNYGNAWLGPEYQVLDDAGHDNGKVAKTSAASMYDLFAPAEERKKLLPVGEWNHSRIVATGSRFEHWLNGQRVLTCDTSTAGWAEAVAASKFKNVEGFAKNPRGRILLQDHGNEVWYRNLRLIEVPPASADDGGRVTTLALGEEGGIPR